MADEWIKDLGELILDRDERVNLIEKNGNLTQEQKNIVLKED